MASSAAPDAARPVPPPGPRVDVVVLALAVALAATLGWAKTWFVCDDAYIAFRYVANEIGGWGLTWNPPPFRPVEGYTSFAWVLLLDGVWRLTGIDPPHASTWLSLLAGLATLGLGAAFLTHLPLPDRLARHRLVIVGLVMLGVVTNRTFLTWLSSGLETALFNLCLTWWLYEALVGGRGRAWPTRLAAAAVATALTRPDGLLAVAATPLLLLGNAGWRGAFPLLLIPAHLAWRYATYGAWLPNTWFAKRSAPWPEAGVRYAASFILEYGVWVWGVLAIAWGVMRVSAAVRSGAGWRGALPPWRWVVALGVVAAHLGTYTFDLGGDHFEYRVYSHLPLLLFVSAAAMAVQLAPRPAPVVAWLLGFAVASWPIPWTHWSVAATRPQGHASVVAIAEYFPAPLRAPVAVWDDLQAWLISRFVCVRQEEHAWFARYLLDALPAREDGALLPWEPAHAVTSSGSVGILGWTYPGVAVVDAFGLNDAIIARHPRPLTERKMAHERSPPKGYVDCFLPNFLWGDDGYRLKRRALPDDAIRACEDQPWL